MKSAMRRAARQAKEELHRLPCVTGNINHVSAAHRFPFNEPGGKGEYVLPANRAIDPVFSRGTRDLKIKRQKSGITWHINCKPHPWLLLRGRAVGNRPGYERVDLNRGRTFQLHPQHGSRKRSSSRSVGVAASKPVDGIVDARIKEESNLAS
jgi:hypothetical protein